MADEKKSFTGHDFWVQFAREAFITHGLPKVVPWIVDQGKERVEDKKRRRRDKHYFQDAMVKLRARNATAADVIDDFDTNYLDNDTDREDFQVNAAQVGHDDDAHMSDTVDFLEQLAALPDHQAREALLLTRGFIGPRSVDVTEHVVEGLKWVRDNIQDLPGDTKKAIGEQITKLNDWLKDPKVQNWTPGKTAETKTGDALSRARAKLAAAKARR